MKRFISLFLVMVLCLSLAACGGNEAPASSNSEAQTPAENTTAIEETKQEQIALHLNEKVTWGDFEISIIDVRLKDSNGFSVNYSTGGRHYGGPCVVVTYSMKNVGKISGRPPQGLFQLNYGDGYTFIHDVYVNGKHPNIFENGGVNSVTELEILSSEQYYLEAFTVPAEVISNTEAPLYITLFSADSPEESLFRFDIRPFDDVQAEAFYQQALSQMEQQRYSTAAELLAMVQPYKDVKQQLLECNFKAYSGYEYITPLKEEFRVVSGEELKAMLPGTWETSQGETWVFSQDGTLDPGRTKPVDGSKVIVDWTVSAEGCLQTGCWLEDTYEVREVYPNALVVFSSKGSCYHRMWKVG